MVRSSGPGHFSKPLFPPLGSVGGRWRGIHLVEDGAVANYSSAGRPSTLTAAVPRAGWKSGTAFLHTDFWDAPQNRQFSTSGFRFSDFMLSRAPCVHATTAEEKLTTTPSTTLGPHAIARRSNQVGETTALKNGKAKRTLPFFKTVGRWAMWWDPLG